MIEFKYNRALLTDIERKLGSMKSVAPKVLATAVNDTAKDAKKMLAKKAKEAYTVKAGRFSKSMKLKRATKSKPIATITSKGHPMELYDFKVNPAKASKDTDMLRAKNVKANPLKALVKKGGQSNGKDLKAFIVTYKSGHKTIASRVPGTSVTRNYVTKSGKSITIEGEQIKTLPSLAIPTMLKSEKNVYGVLRPNIHKKLKENVEKRIRKVLES